MYLLQFRIPKKKKTEFVMESSFCIKDGRQHIFNNKENKIDRFVKTKKGGIGSPNNSKKNL